MPNWTQNEVQIFGDQQKMELFKKSVESKELKFDFDLIVPKPKVLEKVESVIIEKNKEKIEAENIKGEMKKIMLSKNFFRTSAGMNGVFIIGERNGMLAELSYPSFLSIWNTNLKQLGMHLDLFSRHFGFFGIWI